MRIPKFSQEAPDNKEGPAYENTVPCKKDQSGAGRQSCLAPGWRVGFYIEPCNGPYTIRVLILGSMAFWLIRNMNRSSSVPPFLAAQPHMLPHLPLWGESSTAPMDAAGLDSGWVQIMYHSISPYIYIHTRIHMHMSMRILCVCIHDHICTYIYIYTQTGL